VLRTEHVLSTNSEVTRTQIWFTFFKTVFRLGILPSYQFVLPHSRLVTNSSIYSAIQETVHANYWQVGSCTYNLSCSVFLSPAANCKTPIPITDSILSCHVCTCDHHSTLANWQIFTKLVNGIMEPETILPPYLQFPTIVLTVIIWRSWQLLEWHEYTAVGQNNWNTTDTEQISLLICFWTTFCLRNGGNPSWNRHVQVLNSF
jgi:hypothetical protein